MTAVNLAPLHAEFVIPNDTPDLKILIPYPPGTKKALSWSGGQKINYQPTFKANGVYFAYK